MEIRRRRPVDGCKGSGKIYRTITIKIEMDVHIPTMNGIHYNECAHSTQTVILYNDVHIFTQIIIH